jgi:hypothetical protein
MNIVFTLHDLSVLRAFEKVIRHLCGLGNQVKVLHGNAYSDKPVVVDSALRACNSELSNFESMPMLFRKKWLRLSNVREMVDYANYLRPFHPTPWEARRWRRQIIFKPISKALKYSKITNKLFASNSIFLMLKWMERLVPPDPDILQWLKSNQPDVVVSSPYILPRTSEIEYIQAAQALQIPTIAIVLSWDNLTTKGTFHIIPDAVFVWNEALAKEATSIHDVPQSKIFITGAPVFDFWFEMEPMLSYHSFCNQVGISAVQPYVLYLCSSKYISGDETSFVRAFAAALQGNPNTAHIGVMVRPHPLNASIWDGFEDQNIAIWPKDPSWVDTAAAKQDYYNSIYYSTAVVGVNTSAFLEAAILDKPCVTILNAQYRFKQSERGHFRHLLNGDFLEVTHSFPESASVIAAILSGKDSKKEQRFRFVCDFIRPHGLDQSASEIMAKAIESAALRKDFQPYSHN